jgi:sec-independent protein translocase protein TatB
MPTFPGRLRRRAPNALQPLERIAPMDGRDDLPGVRERNPQCAREGVGRHGLKGEHSGSGYHAACYVAAVFGLSFGEFVVLVLVAVVVLGPKEMPRYLRKAGQFAGRLRRMAYDMREKSGIDEVLRTEGIDRDIAEIRRLARGEIGGVVAAVRSAANGARFDDVARSPYQGASPAPLPAGTSPGPAPVPLLIPARPLVVDRAREYPGEGADSYGALPEDSTVYGGALPPSPLAGDPLYAHGDATRTGEGEREGSSESPS